MPPNPRRANGHRRRQLEARVKARDTHCALCGRWVDPDIPYAQPDRHSRRCTRDRCDGCVPHPWAASVDENIPVSRGGSPYDPANCHLMHWYCNTQIKGAHTLQEAKVKLAMQMGGKLPAKPQANVKPTKNWFE